MNDEPTEWDIENGNFNKPVDFQETISGYPNHQHPRINWSLATEPDLQISPEKLEELMETNETIIAPLVVQEVIEPIVATPRKKSKRINPDSIPVLMIAVSLVTLLMISSFTVSFSGIYQVSAWTGLPVILQWLPALFIDAAILAYTISLVVFSARGESKWRTVLGLAGFATMSVVANVAHTLSFWNGTLADYRAWIGVAITALAPIAVLLASEEITRLAFANPNDSSN